MPEAESWSDRSTLTPMNDQIVPSWDELRRSDGRVESESWIRVFSEGDVLGVDNPTGAGWTDTIGPMDGMRFKETGKDGNPPPEFWGRATEETRTYHVLTWSCCKCENAYTTVTPRVTGTFGEGIIWTGDACIPPGCRLPIR
jgi:hypothetical protein